MRNDSEEDELDVLSSYCITPITAGHAAWTPLEEGALSTDHKPVVMVLPSAHTSFLRLVRTSSHCRQLHDSTGLDCG